VSDKSKYRVKLEDVLFNEPWEVEVPGVGTVLVRDPTERDRIEARKAARKHPLWDELNEVQKSAEIQKHLARIMLVEPKISEEDYFNANSKILDAILDTVSMVYMKKINELTKKRQELIRDFLEVLKEGNLLSSGS